jgi:hypothetical protein
LSLLLRFRQAPIGFFAADQAIDIGLLKRVMEDFRERGISLEFGREVSLPPRLSGHAPV